MKSILNSLEKLAQKPGPIDYSAEYSYAYTVLDKDKFAILLIDHCAKIAEDAMTLKIPISQIPGLIRNCERLSLLGE